MKEEVAKAWTEALRSGKYEQGHHRLRREVIDGHVYCCLGVLCDISNLHTWNSQTYGVPSEGLLPQTVQNWSGMKTKNGGNIPKIRTLSEQNDFGHTFDQIADFIDIHWRDL